MRFLDLPEDTNSYYKHSYHPDNMNPEIVFTFGSNLSGVHGLGAAKQARYFKGAILGIGEGPQGCSYAIPTKGFIRPDKTFPILSLQQIRESVDRFVDFTERSGRYFYVTPIGTGLAGYKDEDIAPMFKGAVRCWFPEVWRKYLE